jgi:hypothetical protein
MRPFTAMEGAEKTPVRPELVEGLSFSWEGTRKGQGFDGLSPNGVVFQECLA